MKNYATFPEAFKELGNWYLANNASLNDRQRAVIGDIVGLGASPVDLIVNTAELVYADRADLPQDLKTIAAGLFRFASLNGFHGLRDDNRGERAAAILEGGPEDDAPLPAQRYTAPPAFRPPVPTAPPAPTGV